MTLAQYIIARLWWGPLRRPLEIIAYRALVNQSKIFFGPMRGLKFKGGLSQILGIYELHVQAEILNNLGKGDVFYDAGANKGYFTLLGARCVGDKGFVYAFEPFLYNVNWVKKLISDNNILNCIVIPEALSDVSGIAELYYDDKGDTTIPSLMQRQMGPSLSVHTTTLDEFVYKYRQPTLIKLDVEGAEVLVLRGAIRLLASELAPTWIIEIHSKENDSLVKGLLGLYGYRIYTVAHPYKRRKQYPYHILARKF
jgi:FkbM family methyltransferase